MQIDTILLAKLHQNCVKVEKQVSLNTVAKSKSRSRSKDVFLKTSFRKTRAKQSKRTWNFYLSKYLI